MTKPSSIKSTDLDKYANCDLHELEGIIRDFQQSAPSPETKTAIRVVRQALRNRQHQIKSQVMNFEQTNDHHLLIFDSTENFSKIAGNSVLFYTLTIADRIHRRYSVKHDTDDYFRSNDGIVSIRSRAQLETQLRSIGVQPDPSRTTSELHFYTLPRAYNFEQIAKLRDKSHQDVERITSIILPKSPIPALYNLILETNRLIYYNCKRVSDTLARETILREVMLDANEILIGYLNFANAKPSSGLVRRQSQTSVFPIFSKTATPPESTQAQNLLAILINVRDLRNCLANVENLHLIHHRELCDILEKIVEIERMVAREYARQIQKDRLNSAGAKHEQ